MPTDRELELLAVIERANRETDSYNPREAGGWQAVVDRVQDVLASVDTSALAERNVPGGCVYCGGSGVIEDYEGDRDCSGCDGTGTPRALAEGGENRG